VDAPVLVAHPPGAVVPELVVKLLFKALVVIPRLVFVRKLARPLALAPWVADADQLQPVDVPNLQNAVGVVEEDARLTSALSFAAAIVLHNVCTANEEPLLVVLLQVFPECCRLNGLSDLRGSQVELLRGAASQVDEGLSHGPTVEGFIASVELGVGLFHEGDPELIWIGAVAVERRL